MLKRPRFSFPSPLYAIADRMGRSGLSYIDLAQQICAGGAKVLQLRFKNGKDQKDRAVREFLHIAYQVRIISQRYGCMLIINDRADIALALDADGVHVGQDDLPLMAVRKVLGPDKIIGVSTHDLAQAIEAQGGGADYIGFGPLFSTQTKETGYTARGLDQLRTIRSHVDVPIVAIGGVNGQRAPAALDAGANAVAMISDIVLSRQVTRKVQTILGELSPLRQPETK